MRPMMQLLSKRSVRGLHSSAVERWLALEHHQLAWSPSVRSARSVGNGSHAHYLRARSHGLCQ